MGTQGANFAYPLQAATIGRPWWRWAFCLSGVATPLIVIYGIVTRGGREFI